MHWNVLRVVAASNRIIRRYCLFYDYETGVFSSRKLEQATYDSVAFRYITADTHPDHDTIATFRKRFLSELTDLFALVLVMAQAMGLLQLGKVSLDGTKIKANASKHKAMSWSHANKLEEQLRAEVTELLAQAEQADTKAQPSLDIPEELKRREDRLAAIAQAKAEIERRGASARRSGAGGVRREACAPPEEREGDGQEDGRSATAGADTGSEEAGSGELHGRGITYHAVNGRLRAGLQRAGGSGCGQPYSGDQPRH